MDALHKPTDFLTRVNLTHVYSVDDDLIFKSKIKKRFGKFTIQNLFRPVEDRGSALEERVAVWFLSGPRAGIGQQVPLLLFASSFRYDHPLAARHTSQQEAIVNQRMLCTIHQTLPSEGP